MSPLPTIIYTTSTSVCTSFKTCASTIMPTMSRMSAFGTFLTQEIIDTIIEAYSREKGKYSTYSAASALATALGSFGQIYPPTHFLKNLLLRASLFF